MFQESGKSAIAPWPNFTLLLAFAFVYLLSSLVRLERLVRLVCLVRTEHLLLVLRAMEVA